MGSFSGQKSIRIVFVCIQIFYMLVVFIIRFCNKSCSVCSSFLQDSPGIIGLDYALHVSTARGGGGRFTYIFNEIRQEVNNILFVLELIQDYKYFRILLKWHRCLNIPYSPTNRHGSPLGTCPFRANYALFCYKQTLSIPLLSEQDAEAKLLGPRTKADTA